LKRHAHANAHAQVAGKPPAFAPNPSPSLRTGTELDLFGWLKDAFANEAYAPPAEGVKANAKHILVKNLELCNQIKAQVASGATTFEDAALQYSTCPSRNEGGSLGNFKPGMMVAEFDKAVFGADSESGKRNPVGEVVGPVETQFGFHLIKIMSRNMPSKTVNGAFTEEVA
jgi:peptidyl-prolyl cis-trans isomerase C